MNNEIRRRSHIWGEKLITLKHVRYELMIKNKDDSGYDKE